MVSLASVWRIDKKEQFCNMVGEVGRQMSAIDLA